MNQKIIKRLILVFIFSIIIIICLIVGLIKNINKDTKDEQTDIEAEHVEEAVLNPEQVFQPIADKNNYFAVKRIVTYLDACIEQINGDWPVDPLSPFESERTVEGLRKKGMGNFRGILDSAYINEFTKSEQWISNMLNKFKPKIHLSENNKYSRIIDNIYEAEVDYTKTLFLVYSKLNGVQNNFLIKLDTENYIYSVLLDEYVQKYEFKPTMDKNSIKIFNIPISKNDENSVEFDSVNDEKMCLEYISIYKNICINDSQKLYSLLDEEYRKKRFNNFTNFKNWINDIYGQIEEIDVARYNETYLDDGTLLYRVLDNNNNIYTFKIKNNNILDYKIQLDDYTIPTQEFTEKYNSANEKEKTLANIQIFFKMLNNKDYYSAYNILDDNYKANNFKTLDEFKQYAQSHFFSQNVLKSSEDFKKVGAYYSVIINYAESSDDNVEILQKNFIVDLGKETEFKMSFNK